MMLPLCSPQIPLDETINHILDQIYKQHKLPQITSRTIFKRLLERVTKGTVFSFNGKLYKQADGCSMGNPLSPTLANIFMCKLEEDVVTPRNLPFYDRYVDDCQKPGKLQVHWKSAIPERWKRNTILGALHRAKRIASNWKAEVKAIKQSFVKAGYPVKLINEVIYDFEIPKSDETIIPVNWFDERPKLGIRIPFCRANEV